MRSLPGSLLLLLAAQLEAQQLLPTAIRKMPPDQGEKFLHEYCAFGDTSAPLAVHQAPLQPALAARALVDSEDADILRANASAQLQLRPPFAAHLDLQAVGIGAAQTREDREGEAWQLFRRAADALSRLQRRQWACPGATNSCSGIGYPYSCCPTGEVCVQVQDTGLGPVGCCPAGQTCGGSISGCASGSTGCPSNLGGGCCIPGFVCEGVGCVRSDTGATTPATSSTTTPSTPPQSTAVYTVTVTDRLPGTTITETQTVGGSPPSTTPSSSTPPPSSAPTDTTSGGASAPVRATTLTSSGPYCPTGFYACLASAGGGCCQTGRDCQTTSCPPVAMTTVVDGNGHTVVVPASGAPAATTASCASGWFLCGADAGPVAGCCPTGYGCGTASCSLATAGGAATVAKQLPGSNAAGGRAGGLHMPLALSAAAAAVIWAGLL